MAEFKVQCSEAVFLIQAAMSMARTPEGRETEVNCLAGINVLNCLQSFCWLDEVESNYSQYKKPVSLLK